LVQEGKREGDGCFSEVRGEDPIIGAWGQIVEVCILPRIRVNAKKRWNLLVSGSVQRHEGGEGFRGNG